QVRSLCSPDRRAEEIRINRWIHGATAIVHELEGRRAGGTRELAQEGHTLGERGIAACVVIGRREAAIEGVPHCRQVRKVAKKREGLKSWVRHRKRNERRVRGSDEIILSADKMDFHVGGAGSIHRSGVEK